MLLNILLILILSQKTPNFSIWKNYAVKRK